jgi:hypothetical protein
MAYPDRVPCVKLSQQHHWQQTRGASQVFVKNSNSPKTYTGSTSSSTSQAQLGSNGIS